MSTLSLSVTITCLQLIRSCIDQIILRLQDTLRSNEVPDLESGRPTPGSSQALSPDENTTRLCTKCLHGRRRPCYDNYTQSCFYHLNGVERDQRGLPRSYQ
jgi:hypothetical protein